MAEIIKNVGTDAHVEPAFVSRATDPVVSNVATPSDFAAQFPNPLDQSELITMCEEVNALRAIPEIMTGLKTYTWREMTSLAFTSGSYTYAGFSDGACPEEYEHDGSNKSVDLKNLGAKKSLTLSDILHSAASIGAGYGINNLIGGWAGSAGMPGGENAAPSLIQQTVSDLKAKEMTLAGVLVLNALDQMLVVGNDTSNALNFDGIEALVLTGTSHFNTLADASGTFSAADFDRFLGEGCAKPTHIFGHPAAIQEMLSSYFQLGFQGSQTISLGSGQRVVPGFNFAGEVNTGIGRLICVADTNFTRTDRGGGVFESNLYPLRMTHNGDPLVYRMTQIPLAFKDLTPGCTAISFQIWTKTALVIKALCAQAVYKKRFTGRIITTCTKI